MQGEEKREYWGFELIETQTITEIEGEGKWLKHSKSGINVLVLQNHDPHKVFSIQFGTNPKDNKGAAHIVEHAVCCASKKYPLKEAFMAASQGSISTTMNACTYPDRTMYYVASAHEKDLLGMAEVFLDMVFHPCLEDSSQYFFQEGWHYIYDEEMNKLDFSGVVYHEMLGEYGEGSSYLQHYEMETLFPNTSYQYDAGGLPEEIVKLSEKEFIDFYHEFYVGDNATIVLYGDLNLENILKSLDQKSLQNVRRGKKALPPKVEMCFEKPQYTAGYYPSANEQSPVLMSLGFVVGNNINCEERLALEILEQMLVRSAASPLLKGLVVEDQLGMSLSEGGLDSCRQQPVFSIVLKGGQKENALLFERRTLEILEEMVSKGIDLALIDAALESLELELKEADASYEPIGIVYSEMVLSSYLYGGHPFTHIAYKTALAHIKAHSHKGYFEKLIKEKLLLNSHRSLTVVMPNQQMQKDKELKKEQFLEKAREQLGPKGLEEISKMNQWLEALQLEENDESLLKTLPHLTLKDMPTKLPKFKLEQNLVDSIPIQYHSEKTKEIIYFHFLWQAKHLSMVQRKDLGLLAHIFSYVGTKEKSYAEVENTVNTLSGGFRAGLHAYTTYQNSEVLPVFKISCKVLKEHLVAFMAFYKELLTTTHFNEEKRLKELIGHIVYEIERSFEGAPEYRATQRVYTYLCKQGVFEDEVEGIAFYQYIKNLYDHFETSYEPLKERLTKLMDEIFKVKRLKIAITAPSHLKQTIFIQLETLLSSLNQDEPIQQREEIQDCYEGNEGFYNGQEGQSIAKGISLKESGLTYRGQYEVVANILENTYLWDRVRLQGGAYGCDILLSKEGYLVICSYCDPQLEKTLLIYDGICSYLSHLKLEESAIERAVVSTLGAFISPESMEQKSERACLYFVTGTPQEERQKIYHEIRQTTLKDFHEMSHVFEALRKNGKVCIWGSKENLQTLKSKFRLIDLRL